MQSVSISMLDADAWTALAYWPALHRCQTVHCTYFMQSFVSVYRYSRTVLSLQFSTVFLDPGPWPLASDAGSNY